MTFDVDHSKLTRGIYISHGKVVGEKEIVTYDIRLCIPYKDRVMTNTTMHSIEHIMAVELEKQFEKIEGYDRIYFGPMGCQTGFYLIVASPIGELEPEKVILKAISDACMASYMKKQVPFRDAIQCGNCRTLAYTRDVEGYISLMKSLADKELVKGLKKYPYIEKVESTGMYVVSVGRDTVVVEMVLSLHE